MRCILAKLMNTLNCVYMVVMAVVATLLHRFVAGLSMVFDEPVSMEEGFPLVVTVRGCDLDFLPFGALPQSLLLPLFRATSSALFF